jgi:pimeloyl-ACP methyl ester carboxylesterase
MLRFQEPGRADAEMEADVAATMSRMFAGLLTGSAPLPDWINADEFEHYVTEFSRTGFTGALNWYRNYDRNWESTPQLADTQITVPALFVGGTADPVGPTMRPERAREVAAGPYTEEWIEGAGHWVQQERPDDVNRILLAFLSEVERS